MTRCIINCVNIKVEIFIYVYFLVKKTLNESDDNYCRGGVTNHSLRIHPVSVVMGPPL